MERQLTHLVRLVDDLLEVSRITRGLDRRAARAARPRDAGPASALDTSRPVFEAAGHALTVDRCRRCRSRCRATAVRLTQVFANLLTNAAKYTNAGGHISRHGDGAAASAPSSSVRDNGIGIPADHLDSVFDMFMQVDRSNRRAQGGLGIGLDAGPQPRRRCTAASRGAQRGPGRGSEFVVAAAGD